MEIYSIIWRLLEINSLNEELYGQASQVEQLMPSVVGNMSGLRAQTEFKLEFSEES